MFNDNIENLQVRDLGDGNKLMVSVWNVEADLEENWRDRLFFIRPDMFTFESCSIFVERDGKRITILDADASDRPKGMQFFRADKFFDADRSGSAIWDAIEEHVNEAANDTDFDWDLEAAEREADDRLHMMREEGL